MPINHPSQANATITANISFSEPGYQLVKEVLVQVYIMAVKMDANGYPEVTLSLHSQTPLSQHGGGNLPNTVVTSIPIGGIPTGVPVMVNALVIANENMMLYPQSQNVFNLPALGTAEVNFSS